MSSLRAELKVRLEEAGVFTTETVRTYVKFLGLAGLSGLAGWAYFATTGPVALAAFVVLMGVSTGLVMMGHESGHGGVSKKPFVNDLLGWLAFPVAAGLSMSFWKWRHNTMHHAYPNVPDKNPS